MTTKKTCAECWRAKSRYSSKWCDWHWMMRQPIEEQIEFAGRRLSRAEKAPGYERRARIAKTEWPAGHRWCAGCQSFIPDFYARGSRCRACASQAAHASHIKRTYDLTETEYRELFAFQGGRCYVCGVETRASRLAVDHDHASGAVRGLLCANDQWGCNVSLRRLLGDLAAAQALLRYVERSPLERLRSGEPPYPRSGDQLSSSAGTSGGSSISPPKVRMTSV